MEEFIKKQLAKNTQRSYARVLARLKKRYPEELPTGNKWVRGYQEELKASGLGNRTVNHHIEIINSFYKYKFGERLLYDRLKEQKAVVEFLSEEEINRLLSAADGEFRTVLMFMLDTGVRVSELEEISRRTNSELKQDLVIVGKGGKQRMIIISNETLARLQPGQLFGKTWTVRKVQYNLKQLQKKNGFTHSIHPHMLRHTFATRMLVAGVNIQEIKDMLGHAYLSTTEIYTHVTNERLRDVWKKYQEARQG